MYTASFVSGESTLTEADIDSMNAKWLENQFFPIIKSHVADKDGEIRVEQGVIVLVLESAVTAALPGSGTDAEIEERKYAKVQHGVTGEVGVIPSDCLDDTEWVGWTLNKLAEQRVSAIVTGRHADEKFDFSGFHYDGRDKALEIIAKYSGVPEVIDAQIPALKVCMFGVERVCLYCAICY